MYELFMNQLVKVETFQSPNQPNGQAVIKNGVATVTGYDLDTTLFFEAMPAKNEPIGTIGELHYVNGNLVWVYVALPPDPDAELATAITNATTLEELKKALTGTNGNLARVKGKLK